MNIEIPEGRRLSLLSYTAGNYEVLLTRMSFEQDWKWQVMRDCGGFFSDDDREGEAHTVGEAIAAAEAALKELEACATK